MGLDFAIALRFDPRDAFQQALQENCVISWSRRNAGRKVGVVDRKPFSGTDQRIVVKAGGCHRVNAGAQSGNVLGRKEVCQNRAAGIGGSADQPGIAESMRIKPDCRIVDSLATEHLYCKSGAERGHGRSDLEGSRRKESRDAVGGACADDGTRCQSKPGGNIEFDLRDRRSYRMGARQEGSIHDLADPVRPASCRGVQTGL